MNSITPSNVVLGYLNKVQSVKVEKMFSDLFNICNELSNKGIYIPIDFKIDDEFFSDVICDEIWYYLSCRMICEHHSILSYSLTDFGKTNAEVLLSNCKKKNTESWTIFEGILEQVLS